MLSEVFLNTCSKMSYGKHVPDFAYNTNNEFIASILDGYFSGDGTVYCKKSGSGPVLKQVFTNEKSAQLWRGVMNSNKFGCAVRAY